MSAAQPIEESTRLIGPLDGDAARLHWSECESLLSPALARDGWKITGDQLREQIASGLVGLYVVEDFATGSMLAALACEVLDFPNRKVFSVAYCGGHDAYRWAHLIRAIEEEAAKYGCQVVRIPGRKGWGRVFPEYREVQRIFEREVVIP
jgi:hypothetical protein